MTYHHISFHKMTYHDILSYKLNTSFFVAKVRNYGIFIAKIYYNMLIDIFWGSADFIDCTTSCATLQKMAGSKTTKKGNDEVMMKV